jgi:hypothetical protein
MLIEIAAVLELLLFTCAWAKRKRVQRLQVFMGKKDSIRLPMLDQYLKRQTAGASRAEAFVASRLAAVCRKAVQTDSFQSLLLHGIRSVRSRKLLTSTWRITL